MTNKEKIINWFEKKISELKKENTLIELKKREVMREVFSIYLALQTLSIYDELTQKYFDRICKLVFGFSANEISDILVKYGKYKMIKLKILKSESMTLTEKELKVAEEYLDITNNALKVEL